MPLEEAGVEIILEINQFEKNQRKAVAGLLAVNRQLEASGKLIQKRWEKIERVLEMRGARKTTKDFTDLERRLSSIFGRMEGFKNQIQELTQTGVSDKGFDRLIERAERYRQELNRLRAMASRRGADFLIPAIDVDKERLREMKRSLGDIPSLAGAATGGFSSMGASLAAAGIAAGVFTAALGTSVAFMKKALAASDELVNELNRIRIIMGTTSAAAATWAKFARDAGVSTVVLERGLIQLERGMTQLFIAQQKGEESSSGFSRAIETLGIDIKDANLELRSADSVMRDIVKELQGMESSGAKTALAVQLFGRYNRDLVIALIESTRSLEETEAAARKFGNTISTKDIQAMVAWRTATSDLQDAMRGLWSELGSNAVAALAPLIPLLSDFVARLREGFILMSALSQAVVTFTFTTKNWSQAAAEANQYLRDARGELTAAEAAQEQYNVDVAQAAINENIRAQAIAETTRALADLKSAFEDNMDELELRMNRQWDDLFRGRIREALERAIQEAWQTTDLLNDLLERQADIIKNFNRRLEDLRIDERRKQAEFEDDSRRKREDLEKKHLEKLIQIRNRYFDSLEEAVRQNDAVAVLKAMRRRDRELRDENRRYKNEQGDLEENIELKEKKLKEDQARRLEDAKRNRDRQLADAREGYERSLRDLEESRRRAAVIRQLHNRWAEEDLRRSHKQQEDDARRHYLKEQRELQANLDKLNKQAVAAQKRFNTDLANETANGIRNVGAVAVRETSAVAKAVAAVISSNLSQSFVGTAILRMIRAGARILSGTTRRNRTDPDAGNRDAGGIDIFNRPTNVAVAGSGPEAMISVPVPRGQMSINHSFSPLPVNVSGTGGIDAPGVHQIVEQAMITLARQLATHTVKR